MNGACSKSSRILEGGQEVQRLADLVDDLVVMDFLDEVIERDDLDVAELPDLDVSGRIGHRLHLDSSGRVSIERTDGPSRKCRAFCRYSEVVRGAEIRRMASALRLPGGDGPPLPYHRGVQRPTLTRMSTSRRLLTSRYGASCRPRGLCPKPPVTCQDSSSNGEDQPSRP